MHAVEALATVVAKLETGVQAWETESLPHLIDRLPIPKENTPDVESTVDFDTPMGHEGGGQGRVHGPQECRHEAMDVHGEEDTGKHIREIDDDDDKEPGQEHEQHGSE